MLLVIEGSCSAGEPSGQHVAQATLPHAAMAAAGPLAAWHPNALQMAMRCGRFAAATAALRHLSAILQSHAAVSARLGTSMHGSCGRLGTSLVVPKRLMPCRTYGI